jgi:hypothetical protein
MINFRYHVVSLVAVFLALGLGVLFGTSALDRGVLSALNRNQRSLANRNEQLRRQVGDLEKTNSVLGDFAELTKKDLIGGALAGKSVVLVIMDRTDTGVADGVAQTIVDSQARLDGYFKLSDKLDLVSDTRRQQVALLLDSPATDADTLRSALVDRIAGSLLGKTPGIFAKLIDAGLADSRNLAGAQLRPPAAVAAPNTLVVFVGAGQPQMTAVEEKLVVPLARALAGSGAVAAVGQQGSKDLGPLVVLRSDPALHVVTVDGVESPVGQTAAVLGLRAALSGRFGHYGAGAGATAILPSQ